MATSSDQTDKLLDSQLTCGVCLDRYTDPRTLPCQHSYCKDCIDHLIVEIDNGRHIVRCPSCRFPAEVLAQVSGRGFPAAFHINNLLEIYELDSQLTCGVCFDRYTDPRTLPCLHSCCKDCIDHLIVEANNGRHIVKCPFCRSSAEVSGRGAATFPAAFHINNLLEIRQRLEKKAQAASDEVHDEITFSTTQLTQSDDGKLIYKWESQGLKLELPAKSTATVKLKTISSIDFELPKGSSQLSPVYWVECEGELSGPALLELQHCVRAMEERDLSDLKFAVSRVDGPSCKFELREGKFVGSSGKLEIAHFSAWRVVVVSMQLRVGLGPVLLASLYYQKLSPSLYMVNFVAVPHQEAWEQMLLNHFDSSRQYVGGMKTTAVLKENKISLQLHTDSGAKPLTSDHIVDGWRLKPKEDLTVFMSEMFMPSSSSRPHPRLLELRWTGNGIPTSLSQKMTLSGTEGSKWLLMEYPPPKATCSSSRNEGLNTNAIGVDTDDPGVKAFQQYYSILQNALDSHINLIASSSYSQHLISADMNTTIACTPSMPSGDKVNLFLSTVEEHIAEDHELVEVFAEVLIDQGSYLSVIGNDLERTYRHLLEGRETEHHRPSSAVVISNVLREHHEDLVAYIDSCLIQVTNHLFSAGIVTEYIQKSVLNGLFSNASIVAMECQLCVTLDHDPESKLEEVLKVFDQVESPGPNVAGMIRQKLESIRSKLPSPPPPSPPPPPPPDPTIEDIAEHTPWPWCIRCCIL